MTTNSSEVTVGDSASGYHFERVYFLKTKFEGVPIDEGTPDAPSVPVSIGWDWRITNDRSFEVVLTLKTSPTRARPENVEVVVVGRFQLRGQAPPPLAIPRFVLLGAPMLLFPYARNAVSDLSGRGLIGPLLLDPMNLPRLMSGMSLANATAATQIREHPEIASGFGDLNALQGLTKIPAEQ